MRTNPPWEHFQQSSSGRVTDAAAICALIIVAVYFACVVLQWAIDGFPVR